jgi:hypothetical protein
VNSREWGGGDDLEAGSALLADVLILEEELEIWIFVACTCW